MKWFWIVCIFFILFCVGGLIYSMVDNNNQAQKKEVFIHDCIKNGGTIATVGSVWTKEYFVCYPKK